MNSKITYWLLTIALILVGAYLVRYGWKKSDEQPSESSAGSIPYFAPILFGIIILAFGALRLLGSIFGSEK